MLKLTSQVRLVGVLFFTLVTIWELLCLSTVQAQTMPLPAFPSNPVVDSGDLFELYTAEQMSYDDNLFRIPSTGFNLETALGPHASRQDHIQTVSAGFDGQWIIGRQLFLFVGEFDDDKFARNAFLNNTAGNGKFTWDWRLGSYLSGDVGVDFRKSIAGFTNTRSFVKDVIENTNHFASAKWELGPHWLLFGGWNELKVTNGSLARVLDNFRLRAGHAGVQLALNSTDWVGWEYQRTDGSFPGGDLLNGLPFNRDFKENSARFLLKYGFANVFALDGSAGYLKRDYPAAAFAGFSGDVWRASLQWTLSPKTQLVFVGYRELNSYVQAQSDYYVAKGGNVSAMWSPTVKLQFMLSYISDDQHYKNSNSGISASLSRHDKVTTEQLGILYTPAHSVILNLTYGHEQRDSNKPLFSYGDRIITAKLTFKY